MPDATIPQFGGAAAGVAGNGDRPKERVPAGRACRICAQRFSGDARFCPFDGEALDPVDWDPTSDPLLGSVVDGRYEVLEVLGEGGMGTVYRVKHRALERGLALKALRRDLSEDADLPTRFIQEAKAAAAVEHPNVVQITDFGSLSTRQPYFVMELLEGEPLSVLLRKGGQLAPARAVGIAVQVAQALAAAHDAGVIHRDLKPDNIHVRRMGSHDVVKVLDFGLAKLAGTSRLTRAGMVFGTPHYMSPEQAAGEPSDHRVDIYALGVVMFEMLTGRLPFEADSFTGVLAKHMYMDPPSPSQVVGTALGSIETIVLRCLTKKPAERYATMGDLLIDLDRAQAVLSIPPEPGIRRHLDDSGAGELAMSVERRQSLVGRPLFLIAVAGGLIGMAIGGAWVLGTRASASGPASSEPSAFSGTSAAAPSEAASALAPASSGNSEAAEPPASHPAAAAPRASPKKPPPAPKGPPAVTKPKPAGKPGTKPNTEIIDPWAR